MPALIVYPETVLALENGSVLATSAYPEQVPFVKAASVLAGSVARVRRVGCWVYGFPCLVPWVSDGPPVARSGASRASRGGP